MAEARASLWAPADVRPPAPSARPFSWVLRALPLLILFAGLSIAVMVPRGIGYEARLSLLAFGATALFWTLTKVNAAYVALAAVLLLAVGGGVDQEALFETLESDVIWLMIGAFVLGAAIADTGLATRMTRAVAGRGASVRAVSWRIAALLVPMAFLIPSTSGRAAVMLPLFRSLSDAARDRAVTRALALLIPAVILVSTISSLVGAGSHLIANDLLDEVADREIGFGAWALYGLPLGLAASAAAVLAVTHLFLTAEQRGLRLEPTAPPRESLSTAEWKTLIVAAATIAMWLSEPLHGLEIATVSVLAALVLTLPHVGVLSWKDGLKAVEWNLILFVGAALALGEALIESGAAKWLIGEAIAGIGLNDGGAPVVVVTGLAVIGLTSHIYLASHAVRTAALLPPLLYLAVALKLDLVAVAFIAVAALDYCLTFPISSKALLMFAELERETWTPADLLKLSAVLLPVHLILIVALYFLYWRWAGLAL